MGCYLNGSVPVFKVLADENRFRIIDLLLSHDFYVGALASHLGISKAAVSKHLQVLNRLKPKMIGSRFRVPGSEQCH
jgi:predicted transcriptional regulator